MSVIGRMGNRFVPALLLGAAIYLLLAIYADWRSVMLAFRGFRWPLLLPALALAFGNYLVRFIRWEYYLRWLRIRIPGVESLVIFFSGLIMSITPGKLGEVLKSYLLKRVGGVSISRSAPIVLAERLTDFLALVVLSAWGVLLTGSGRGLLLISLVIVLGLLGLLSSRRLSLMLIDQLVRLPLLSRAGDRLRTAYDSVASLLTWKPLLVATPLSILSWFFECVAFTVVLVGFGVGLDQVSIPQATFIYSLGTIAGALSMLPGGIGATEGLMTMLLVRQGVPEPIAVSATFIVRACTLWFAVLVGMLFLLPNQHRFAGVAEEVLASGQGPETRP